MLVLLAVGVAVRVLATVTFRPGLELYADSYSYMLNAHHLQLDWFHPMGYAIFLRLLWWTRYTLVLVIAQHLVGLAVGLLIYLLLRRTRMRPAYAAIAAAPVLLDAYQIDVEQFVLSDTLFLLLIVVACALVLAPRRQHPALAAAAGLSLAAAALTRGVGAPVAVPLAAYLFVRRVGWQPVTAFVAVAALPVVGYVVAFHARYNHYGIETVDGLWLYGYTASFARCDQLPSKDQSLCPAGPVHERASSEFYTWSRHSPLYEHYRWAERPQRGQKFAVDVILAQPSDYLTTSAKSLARDFAPDRSDVHWAWPIESWRMSASPPLPRVNVDFAGDTFAQDQTRHRSGQRQPNATGARILSTYQDVAYAWGPTLPLGVLLPLLALALRRTRRQRSTAAALTLGASGLILLVVPAMTVTQDFRYVLPAQALLWPAAVLAGVALWRRESTIPADAVAAVVPEPREPAAVPITGTEASEVV